MPHPSNTALRSIQCTQCSAPLELHGGRRVESLTCPYCGSVLDTKHEFKILKKFRGEIKKIYAPLELGMQGKIKGAQFTIIGVIQYHTIGEYHSWYEFLMYSPTHGYAWLEYDNGHFIFSYRVRELPDREIRQITKYRFTFRHNNFKVYEFYKAKIQYVAGELTWVANVGDQVKLVEAVSPPYIYTQEKTSAEVEYTLGEYLDPQIVYQAFKLTGSARKPKEVHPAQPFAASALLQGLSKAGKIFTPLNLLALIAILLVGSGNKVLISHVNPDEYLAGSAEKPFTVNKSNRLIALNLYSDLDNAWAWYDVEVQKSGAPLFSMSKQISYYQGYEGGEHWSEGSKKARAYFKVSEPGVYTIQVWGEGGTGNRGTTPQNRSLRMEVKEGVIVSRYFIAMTVLSLLALMAVPLSKWHFENKRWGEYEDDDD
ncbi:MAG: hypothetical protein AMJ53_01920 [Gammaproteobacteria bacterium SG8_11]|nr:MAG: hypothetical protein AMJ53_01920 [Gammaproteobacteria bacterium SG8_11]